MLRTINGIRVLVNTKDLTGRTFGRLTVVSFVGFMKHKATWLCRCTCGTEKRIGSNPLLRGMTESCGCLHREIVGDKFRKHGLHGIPEYRIWRDMRDRCRRTSHSSYHNYGFRGVRVCKRWNSFQKFYNDMGPRPSSKHSIERKNNDGNYTPRNCCWATKYEQSRNKRQNVWVEVDGERMILKDVATKYGVDYFVLHGRYCRLGWSLERAVSEPVHRRRKK